MIRDLVAISKKAAESTPGHPVYVAGDLTMTGSPIKNRRDLCTGFEVEELLTEKRYRYFVCKSSDLEEVKVV